MTKTPTGGRNLHGHAGRHALMGPGPQVGGSSTDMRSGTRSRGRVLKTRLTRRLALVPALLLPILMLALACAAPQAAPYVPPDPTAAPNIAATVAARDAALPQGGPAPTPVPEGVSQAARDFAQAHAALVRDWDGVRKDLDSWRQGLDSCSPAALQTAMRDFSADYRAVALAAQDLPRDPAVRWMSARLIEAVENEEAALRRLRDGGDPGPATPEPAAEDKDVSEENGKDESGENGTSNPLPPGFEGVAQARTGSLAIRKEVEDQLVDLRALTGDGSRQQVAGFSGALDDLNARWDRFHKDYDAFRAVQPGLSPGSSLQRLNRLVDQHRELVLAHRDLPVTPAVREGVADVLSQALQDEDAALRKLRGSFQKPEDGDNGAPASSSSANRSAFSPFGSGGGNRPPIISVATPAPTPNGGEGNGTAPTETPAETPEPSPGAAGGSLADADVEPGDPGLFDAFDEQVVAVQGLRWQARLALDRAVSASSEESGAAVDGFASAYDDLLGRWQGFHGSYDRWLANEGGCNRSAVDKALGNFALSMGEIAARARSLPQAAPLRPLGELTVEAAQREEQALRQLQGDWRPFSAAVYQHLDRELAASGSLRRQAQLNLQHLLLRYRLPAP